MIAAWLSEGAPLKQRSLALKPRALSNGISVNWQTAIFLTLRDTQLPWKRTVSLLPL